MIRTTIIILLFSLLHTAAAEDTIPGQNSAGDAEKSRPTEGQEEQSRQPPSPWPQPFTPSQEVGADSQVAFPTDI
jgi:hypothetical protein